MTVALRLLTALLASLIGWVGFTGSVVAGSALTAPPVTYTYGHPGNPGALSFTTTERGPPTTYDRATTYDAVHHWSRGASARQNGATPPAPFAYDHPGLLVQVASVLSQGPVEVVDGELRAPQVTRLAANTACLEVRAAAAVLSSGVGTDVLASGDRI